MGSAFGLAIRTILADEDEERQEDCFNRHHEGKELERVGVKWTQAVKWRTIPNQPESIPQEVEKDKREATCGASHPVANPFGAGSTLVRGQLHLFYFLIRRGDLIAESIHDDVVAVAIPTVGLGNGAPRRQ